MELIPGEWILCFWMSKDELIETPVAYRDSRTEGMKEKWKTLMPEMETFQRTGINFYIFNTLFQLLASRNSEALEENVQDPFYPMLYQLPVYRERHINELTISSTSQLLGVEGDQWDTEILDKLNLNKELLGEVISAGNPPGTGDDS